MAELNVCTACGGDDRHTKCPKGGYTFFEAFRDIERINARSGSPHQHEGEQK